MIAHVRLISVILALSVLLTICPATLSAQFSWPRSFEGECIRIEYLMPTLAQDDPYVDISGYTLSLSGRVKIGERTLLTAEIPYVSTTMSISYPMFGISESETKSALGNIYVGLETIQDKGPVFWEVGMRLPTLSEKKSDAAMLAIFGDVNRWEAYVHHLLALQAALNYRNAYQSGIVLFFRTGPSIWIPTKSGANNDTEVFLDYGGGIGYENETIRVGGGVSGRVIITEEEFLFNDKRAYHHAELGVNVRLAQFRPAVFIRFPIEKELKDAISKTFGFSLAYVF